MGQSKPHVGHCNIASTFYRFSMFLALIHACQKRQGTTKSFEGQDFVLDAFSGSNLNTNSFCYELMRGIK